MALLPEEDDMPSLDESDPDDEKVSEEEQLNGNSSTDSLHLDEEEEECDEGGSSGSGLSCPCPMQCCDLSDRFVGWSIVLRIDQTASGEGSGNGSGLPGADGDNNSDGVGLPGISVSASTSLSDTASENMSTRATLGDTPSVPDIDAENNGEDSNSANSSPSSSSNTVEERMRRIHNSIFSSLEHDLAELVRIREETIQFLETGVRPSEEEGRSAGLVSSTTRLSLDDVGHGDEAEHSSVVRDEPDRNSDGGHRLSDPFIMRERLTFQTRPRIIAVARSRTAPSAMSMESRMNRQGEDPNVVKMDGRSYTPTGDYSNAPPGQPAKPYVELGPTTCDEKGIAAKKILSKLQYGDPEDEGASFVRRFWRETSTVEGNPGGSGSTTTPLSVDIAAIADRTASLEASLEEAFDGLRLRLQEMGPQRREGNSEGSTQTGGQSERNGGGGRESSTNTNNNNQIRDNLGSSSLSYEAWDAETSIMNNPLNYDIWDELEDGSDAGPIITSRINMAERRASSTRVVRSHNERSMSNSTCNIGVGTSPMEGAEQDDDTTDDDEVSNYFQIRNMTSSSSFQDAEGEGRAFLAEMGVSDDLEQELMDMFTFSEDEFNIPSSTSVEANTEEMELPSPLFTRGEEEQVGGDMDMEGDVQEGEESRNERVAENEDSTRTDMDSGVTAPNITLEDGTFHFCPNREDDCSIRVYLDEHDLNFPLLALDESHNEEDHGEGEHN